ncbi:MAG: translation initiation factor IF-3 [Chloroflexi bacterium]|nr:translation initiation factor IF-3 [Chloroflexota bacterium]
MIRVPQVRVVDDEGSQLGIMPTPEALKLAQEKGYDLVEVAPMAAPPVVRLLDYGQFKYEQTRREKEARRHQRSVEFKEIRLTPKIGQGDFETKVRRATQFLEEGDRIKVTVRFRGRELTHAYLGRDLLLKFADMVKDHGTIERQPLLEGKSMFIVVAATHKPKTAPETPERPGARSSEAQRTNGTVPVAPAEQPTAVEAVPPAAEPEPIVAEPAPATEPVATPAQAATAARATPQPTGAGTAGDA